MGEISDVLIPPNMRFNMFMDKSFVRRVRDDCKNMVLSSFHQFQMFDHLKKFVSSMATTAIGRP